MRVWGVSVDYAQSHKAFQEGCQIRTDLLTDPNGRVGARIGNLKGNRHVRTTVVLDDQNRVLRVFDPVKPLGHADQLLAVLGT